MMKPRLKKDNQLLAAVREKDLNGARLLLKKGADANTKDFVGLTPLHWACLNDGCLEMAKLLALPHSMCQRL